MENIPSSLIGYSKTAVNNIIMQKNNQIKTQQDDIDFLREENKRLKIKLKLKKLEDQEPSLDSWILLLNLFPIINGIKKRKMNHLKAHFAFCFILSLIF